MATTNNLLIVLNSKPELKYNHYEAYTMAWVAKKYHMVATVTLMYGPYAAEMVKKGALAGFVMTDKIKELIASQFDDIKKGKYPDHLEQLARFIKNKLGISIVSCAPFHVLEGFADEIADTSQIEDFIEPVGLKKACKLMLEADQILYY